MLEEFRLLFTECPFADFRIESKLKKSSAAIASKNPEDPGASKPDKTTFTAYSQDRSKPHRGNVMQTSDDQASKIINEALAQIPELKRFDIDSQEFKLWRRYTKLGVIAKVFGQTSIHVGEFDSIRFRHPAKTVGDVLIGELTRQRNYITGLGDASILLKAMLKEVEETRDARLHTQFQSPPRNPAELKQLNRIFVVHGRDHDAKDSVELFLIRLGLCPVVLQEMPNNGRTIIEKFEDYSDVGFAVILCTPDDVGALATESSNLRPRPRQNVIFEWGFFTGKLGRGRVAVLVKNDADGTEPVRPTDYDGVMHYPMMDSRQWQNDVLKELQTAGYDVDANQIV